MKTLLTFFIYSAILFLYIWSLFFIVGQGESGIKTFAFGGVVLLNITSAFFIGAVVYSFVLDLLNSKKW